jgi:hypothetical protein
MHQRVEDHEQYVSDMPMYFRRRRQLRACRQARLLSHPGRDLEEPVSDHRRRAEQEETRSIAKQPRGVLGRRVGRGR